MKRNLTRLMMGFGIVGSATAQTTVTGPSSSQSPYFNPTVSGHTVTSVLTTTDVVAGYTMCGIPDGMGAFDNGNGTFSLFMNHEVPYPSANTGIVRAHGASGAFVSKWVINKSTLSVVSGADLIQNLKLWNGSGYTTYNSANTSTLANLSRFCSGDLPAVTAYYNSATGKGTQERMFMNGEESGNEGRLFAHIATGPNVGTSYELPYLGKFSCENAVASPHRSDKTIVIGMDDTTPGQVYVYVGTKLSSGTEIDKAGLTNGALYGVGVTGLINEVNASTPAANTTFSLISLGNVTAITGASLNTISNNLGVTNFLRPEDGCWDPSSPNDFYFNTTNAFNSNSRLWRLRFTDIENPQLGGVITAVLDGSEGQQMLDNMTIDNSGHIYLCEDVGNNAWNGRILRYDIAADVLTPIGQHDPSRFITGGANFLTQDEETSGIVDVQAILGPGMFMFVTQAHYAIAGAPVEGGQLMTLFSPVSFSANPEVNVQGNAVNIAAGNTAVSATDNTNFGLVNTGTSVSRTFVIQNTGTGALVVSGINVTGTNAGDFTLVNPPAFPLTIAANGSQTITVQFNTPILGVRTATLNVYNNDLNENIYDFAVQGTGAAPEINLEGNNVSIADGNTAISTNDNTDFGSVIYNTPVTKVFSIHNTGTGTLSLSSMSITGANAAMFSFVSPLTFPMSLAGGASQQFTVQYLSTSVGTHTASIVVNSSDADESVYDFMIAGKSLQDVGIKTLSKSETFVSLYPNPAKDEATLKMNLDNNARVTVTVFDIQGKIVMHTIEKELEKGEREITLNTSSLKNGEYFVKLINGNQSANVKLVVIH